jgi:hypothetical protein
VIVRSSNSKYRVKSKNIICSLLFVLTVHLCTAQEGSNNGRIYTNQSNDGRTLSRDSDGALTLSISREEADISPVTNSRLSGNLQKALELCNEMLATNATQRWAVNARMQIFGEMGEFSKAQKDFLFLTEHYPDFLEAYDSWAEILLRQPISDNGTSAFLDWLSSSEPRKKVAAKNVILNNLIELRNKEAECFDSHDVEIQRSALRVLQMGLKLQPNLGAKLEK